MDEVTKSIYWEAPEHTHIEKTSNWYWSLGIIALTGAIASIILGNVLFGIIILLGAFTMFLTGNKLPRIIPYEVSVHGVIVDNELHPYVALDSYFLDETNTVNPQLIVKPKKLFTQLIIAPVPVEYVDHIEDILRPRLPEEHLEEPIAHKILEFFGF